MGSYEGKYSHLVSLRQGERTYLVACLVQPDRSCGNRKTPSTLRTFPEVIQKLYADSEAYSE